MWLNLPANQWHSNVVADCLQRAMSRYNIRPDPIELEITETTFMKPPELSTKLLQGMQEEGVRIAIDDFGTGYSSMSYLTY